MRLFILGVTLILTNFIRSPVLGNGVERLWVWHPQPALKKSASAWNMKLGSLASGEPGPSHLPWRRWALCPSRAGSGEGPTLPDLVKTVCLTTPLS